MYNSVSEISPDCLDPILCVRLRRAWRTFGPDGLADSLELLLVDKHEDTIQASICKRLASDYDVLLNENSIYDLRAFDVVQKPKSNEMTASDYVIYFVDGTLLTLSDYPFFKESTFIFKPFTDILGYSTFCEGPLFDVIGAVVDFDDRLDSDGCRRFMLQDLEHNRLVFRISNSYVGKLKDYPPVSKNGKYKAFVIILQLCKKVIYEDEVCVMGHLPVTDVICNPKLDEIKSYYSSFILKPMTLCFDEAKFLSPLIKCGKRELGGPGRDVFSINHLTYFEEVINLWTIGSVINIRSDMGWFSVSCSRCNRESICGTFHVFCPKCGQDLTYFAKFKLFLEVSDFRGTRSCFIIENEVATFLLENKVYSLLKMHSQSSPLSDIPASLSHIIGRELLFKVSLSEQKNIPTDVPVYDVRNCCVCPVLLQHYKEKMFHNMEPLGSDDTDVSDSNSEYSSSDYIISSGELTDGDDDSDCST